MLAENYFLIALAFVWIIAAVAQDFRKREIANWWNFSLIAVALAYRFFLAVYLWNFFYLVYGLIGFAVFFALANIFYYGRVFAGGDAKLLMGLGAVLPFSNLFFENLQIFLYFIILLMFAGSVYGLVYSIVLSAKHKKEFSKEFLKQFSKNKKIFKIFFVLAAVIFILTLLLGIFVHEYLFLYFALVAFAFPFLYSYAKAIEEACMIKEVSPKNLTIGDWLYEKVRVGRKIIKPNWEGLNERELAILKKTKKKILVKEGIPFTPAFLIAFGVLIWMLKKGILGLL